jgi:hypothetical protein
MGNLTFTEWAYATITAQLLGWLGSIFDLILLSVIATLALLSLMIERVVNYRRSRRPVTTPADSRCLQQIGDTYKSHPCTLPADGHTMHRCAFGDCEWGHH